MRSSKDGLSSKEVRTPPYSYNRNIHSKDTDFLQYDYFDFMKPTDYTYSRSTDEDNDVKSALAIDVKLAASITRCLT
ncbi:unnamed protein product [Mytilus edulis]|uniref:Uncharacterized protein n=1 Tax=Mytilus edulis TaxID=6550 RepID=A0A8S3V1J0_MYTED|nr:unnamed protein product [Mytilus edulis]